MIASSYQHKGDNKQKLFFHNAIFIHFHSFLQLCKRLSYVSSATDKKPPLLFELTLVY